MTRNVSANEIVDNERVQSRTDVTEDFKRCVVLYCSETVEFEVDGMKFKAACERID